MSPKSYATLRSESQNLSASDLERLAQVRAQSAAELPDPDPDFDASPFEDFNPFPQPRTGPTGPRTQAGKGQSRLSAYKHGLTGRTLILNPTDQAAFDLHCKATVSALAPAGVIETQLANAIAEDLWRIQHGREIENHIFAYNETGHRVSAGTTIAYPEIEEPFAAAKAWLEESKNLQLLTLYQHRLERSVQRNNVQLEALQAKREAARRQALEEEFLLAELAESEGTTYAATPNPNHPEFVFSTAEVLAALTRKKRLEAARELVQKRQTHKNIPAKPLAA